MILKSYQFGIFKRFLLFEVEGSFRAWYLAVSDPVVEGLWVVHTNRSPTIHRADPALTRHHLIPVVCKRSKPFDEPTRGVSRRRAGVTAGHRLMAAQICTKIQ